MEIDERITKAKEQLESIRAVILELSTVETDLARLQRMMEIKILAWPDQHIYRLRDNRLKGYNKSIILHDSDLDKNINDLIESVRIETVFPERKWHDSSHTIFLVKYSTNGYHAHDNSYVNDDFGKNVFLSQQDLIDTLTEQFESEKIQYRKRKDEEKERERINLEQRLAQLNKS